MEKYLENFCLEEICQIDRIVVIEVSQRKSHIIGIFGF